MAMRSLRCLLVLFIGLLAAAAQVQQPQLLDLPGEVPVFVKQSESPKANVATMGLRISSDFDDNALNSQQDHQRDFATIVQPHLGWHVSSARLDWIADYTPGFSRSQQFAAYDSISHVLDSEFQLRLTKRLRLLVHEVYLRSSNPFDQIQAFEFATGPAPGIVPNETTTLTPADVHTDQSSVDIAYTLSAHSTLGVGGDFFDARYDLSSGLSSGRLLQNSSSVNGHAFYMRQLARHQWTGLDYHVQKSTFNSGQSWSVVHSVTYSYTIAVSETMTLSFGVGPERSVTQNAAGMFSASPVPSGAQSAWHGSGGMSAQWSGKRTTVKARLARGIDNGGLLGAVERTTGSVELSHQFGRRWTTKLLGSYDHDTELVGAATLSSGSVATTLTYTLSPSLSFEAQYWRVHMSGNGSLPPGLLADHNRVLMSIVYEHRHALGR